MNIDIATLFPEMLENYLSESVVGRPRAKNIFTVTCHNIRDYTQDKHRRVDDTPYSERQLRLRSTQKKLVLYFQPGKQERWLQRDILSFLVSEVQRIYPEYDCGGILV